MSRLQVQVRYANVVTSLESLACSSDGERATEATSPPPPHTDQISFKPVVFRSSLGNAKLHTYVASKLHWNDVI